MPEEKQEPRLEIIAQKSFAYYPDMYKVVDFLNKTLKDKNVIFGLTKKDEKLTITIYRT